MRTTGCILRLGGILAMAFASGVLADAPPDDPVATPAATATDETGTGLEFDAIEDPLRRADRRLTVAATILRE